MLKNPILLLAALTAAVGLLWKGATSSRGSRLFRVLPLPFWCYTLPMVGTTFGWLPQVHPLYNILSQHLLPVSLILLLVGTDLKGIARLGPMATRLMLAGAAGTILGGLWSFRLYHRWLPPNSWEGIGALAASWIGGSANLLAVKEALRVPDSIIGSLVIVDTTVAYSWMALLIWASGFQEGWARRIGSVRGEPVEPRTKRARRSSFDKLRTNGRVERRTRPVKSHPHTATLSPSERISWAFGGILLAIFVSFGAQSIGRQLPAIGQAVNAATWTVLLVTTVSVILSLTPISKLEQAGISRVGTFALYLLLTSIGARANLKAILEHPVFLALGLTWIITHGVVLGLAGFLLKAPLGLIATASQANIGGPISAPIVGATYHPRLATIGLLMAILGNILGTYLGLLTAFLARWLVGA